MNLNLKKNNIYDSIINKCGLEFQIILLAEEQAELFKAVSKHIRNPSNHDYTDLIEEIADVEIMQEQITHYYNITRKQINKIKKQKIKRLENIILNQNK